MFGEKSCSYIHRSGRTGRAGKNGVCILFYSKREAGLLKMIERTARITFERIGTPQTDDLIGAAAKSAKQMLEEVNPEVRKKKMVYSLPV